MWLRMGLYSFSSLFYFCLFFQAIAIGYAYMSTSSSDMYWKIRALRVLPMFLLPVLGGITYSALKSFTKMRKCESYTTYWSSSLLIKIPRLCLQTFWGAYISAHLCECHMVIRYSLCFWVVSLCVFIYWISYDIG